MGTNSIKHNLSKQDAIGEINLYLKNKDNIILVVEGVSDERFFKKFFKKSNVIIQQSYESKQGVLDIKEFYKENNRVIGVVDKDYDKDYRNDIVYYDYSSMEVMLANDLNAFNSLVAEYYCGPNLDNLKELILKGLLGLSLLRKFNNDNKLGINFSGLSIENIVADYTGVNIDILFDEIDRLNPKKEKWIENKVIAREYIERNINKSYNLNDLLYLTRGHDFITLFNVFCNRENNKGYKDEIIEKSLRCAFSIEAFKKTKLYKHLNNIGII